MGWFYDKCPNTYEGEGIPSDVTGPFLRLNCMEFADIPCTSALDWPPQNWEVSHACHRASQFSCLALCLSHWSLSWTPRAPLLQGPSESCSLGCPFYCSAALTNPPHPLLCPKSTTETVQLTSKNRWSVRDRHLLIFVFYRGPQEATGIDAMKDTWMVAYPTSHPSLVQDN